MSSCPREVRDGEEMQRYPRKQKKKNMKFPARTVRGFDKTSPEQSMTYWSTGGIGEDRGVANGGEAPTVAAEQQRRSKCAPRHLQLQHE